ncbi:hypothetical protein AVEN_236109-1 [Araneus ventricosus]|uniref:Uncharacterized protein n=1 Tax=Araneus ventricosus TaxID=182803 RepID=A0A4Y2ULY8_ARAVE|nr:hypothetical protein AVEN_236109-1 [Araneus ventricosus]
MQGAIIRNRMRRKSVFINLEAFPPCFPNGWIPIIESRDVESGEVRGAIALGYSNFRAVVSRNSPPCPSLSKLNCNTEDSTSTKLGNTIIKAIYV